MRLQIEYETERSARRDKFVSPFISQLHGWFIAQLIVPALRLRFSQDRMDEDLRLLALRQRPYDSKLQLQLIEVPFVRGKQRETAPQKAGIGALIQRRNGGGGICRGENVLT